MRLRTIIFVLALSAFLFALAGSLVYYYSFKNSAFQTMESNIHAELNLLSDQLFFYLSEHVKPVHAMSKINELQSALDGPSPETIVKANKILDNFKESFDIEVSYLMDRHGETLCSSNRNEKDSFVGKNFSFRPYFRKALQGESSTYLALGTASNKRGVYHSHPVYGKSGQNITGVAVIKASIEFVEEKLFRKSDDILLFVSPDGVIFISNRADLRFKLLWQINEEKVDAIKDSRQFGNGPWPWTGFSEYPSGIVTDKSREKHLAYSINLPNFPGWQIINLHNNRQSRQKVMGPFVKILGSVIVSILILTGVLVLFLYRLGINELAKRKKAERELRLSEERYRTIYHKTPVMLHSIDPEGRIVHVSDHWVEVMGYNRDEVLGKQLVNFFTPESREYALNKIFPQFFKSGFCKDVPYTYIKKNGEKIDIILSSYGVRDENGNINRSLAVSMDVTEKNITQKDLQIAKEKLSQYSQNLEQQVKKRTRQFEKAQENLKSLSKNIIASQEREKAAVARELHDHLGQVLTALRIDTVWCEKYLYRLDEKAGKRAEKMCALIDRTIKDVRDMAYRLRPRVLDDLGLADALESLVSDFEKRTNVSCIFKHDPIPEIDDTLSTALYRIGQEALTNALRHSNATSIVLTLSADSGGIVLMIEDNGTGFDQSLDRPAEGFGLEGMKERASLVGGLLEIYSDQSKGTTICCKVKVKG